MTRTQIKILRLLAFTLGGVVALLALLAVVAWVLTSAFDSAAIKAELAHAIRDKKQRELKIDGDVSLSFWPALGLKVSGASLSERNSTEIFARVEEVQVSLSVLPLLKREFVIDGVRLTGLSATVVRDAKGALNIADLLEPGADDTVRFELQQTLVQNSKLVWRDLARGRAYTLAAATLTTGPLGPQARGALTLTGQLTENSSRLGLALNSRYDIDTPARKITLGELKLSVAGAAAGLTELDSSASLARLDYHGATGAGSIDGLLFSLRAQAGGEPLEANMQVPKIAIEGGVALGEALTAAVRAGQAGEASARHADAKFVANGLRLTAEGVSLARITMDANAHAGSTTLRTNLASSLTGSFAGRRLEWGGLGGQIDITDPKRLAKPLRLGLSGQGELDLGRAKASTHLTLRLDESSGQFQINVPTLSPLSLTFEVDINQLNLDKYLLAKGVSSRGASPPQPAAPSAVEASVLEALEGIEGIDFSGHIKVGRLQVSRIKARDVRLDMRNRSKVLEISPYSAYLYDGMLTGLLRLDAGQQRYALKQTLKDVRMGPLLKDAFDSDWLDARGAIVLDLTTEGDTLPKLKQALVGRANIELRDGDVKGFNALSTWRQARAEPNRPPVAASRAEHTEFAEFTGTWRIQQGVARNDDLQARAPLWRATGSGTIDLVNQRIDYLARLEVAEQKGQASTKAWSLVKAASVPVRILGPLDKPEINVAAADIASQAMSGRLGKEKIRLKEKLQLPGLR